MGGATRGRPWERRGGGALGHPRELQVSSMAMGSSRGGGAGGSHGGRFDEEELDPVDASRMLQLFFRDIEVVILWCFSDGFHLKNVAVFKCFNVVVFKLISWCCNEDFGLFCLYKMFQPCFFFKFQSMFYDVATIVANVATSWCGDIVVRISI